MISRSCPYCEYENTTIVLGNSGRFWSSLKLEIHLFLTHKYKYRQLKAGYPDKVVQYVDAQPEDDRVDYDSIILSLKE